MFKAMSTLHIKANDRDYHFMCDTECPLTEVIEVLNKISQSVQVLLDDAMKKLQENQSPSVTEEKPIEEVATV